MQRHFYLHSQAIYMKKRTFLQHRNMWFWDLLLHLQGSNIQYNIIDDAYIAIYSLMQRHFYLHSQAIYMKKRTFLQHRNMWFWDLLLTWIPQVRTTAIANPTPNPSPVKRNNTRSTDFVSEWCGSTYGVVLLHALDTWNPHRPMLPRNERLVNVKKWGESGILPTSSL